MNDVNWPLLPIPHDPAEPPVCPECGGSVAADGYCLTCGIRVPANPDHSSVQVSGWVAAASDLGRQHHRNEDAVAVWATADTAVLVVCDGVSLSDDPDRASAAAVRRTREQLVTELTSPGARSDDPGWLEEILIAAAVSANEAVLAVAATDPTSRPATTWAAAVVTPTLLSWANLGDTRVYLLGGAHTEFVSRDHSVAQEYIDEGLPREVAERMPSAHAITRWLGADAPPPIPAVGNRPHDGSGWLLVCSDGLWNYASAASELLALLDATADPLEQATHLVNWANDQGGVDNITVALARTGPAGMDMVEEPTTVREEEPSANG